MTDEIVRLNDQHYILSTSARVDDRRRVLKHGDTFGVFDRFGDIDQVGPPELGLYHQDTRYLSRLALRLGPGRPLLLSSTVKEDNALLAVDLTNLDVSRGDAIIVPRGTLHLFRSKILWNGTSYDQLRIHNYGHVPVQLPLEVELDADFVDVFEVRGVQRARRGRRLAPRVMDGALEFEYEGLDGRRRCTRIAFDPAPAELSVGRARYDINLAPGEALEYQLAVHCEVNGTTRSYHEVADQALSAFDVARADGAAIEASNGQFTDLMHRAIADLHLMRTDTPRGPYPYAGIPWFCTAFGRDGIITALECLWFDPSVARGVLSYLAATQAQFQNDEQDAQPGKILHETRAGEMATLGEIPFGRYYGSVDATPLFVVLAGAYYERTGDRDFAGSIWPHVCSALAWIERYGDVDGDGFVEYARRTPHGLVHQGWKDSVDAVFHADGTPADGPIALCEVQGYVFAAKRAAAVLARELGDAETAALLDEQAETLRRRFEATFWCEDLGTYALALDGRKELCRVRTSNAGHCLFSGIVSPERARRVALSLTDDTAFSGWGIRTVASTEARYNPMSYHNGSVWPHDNAIIAAGFSRYGLRAEAARILTGLFDASRWFELRRLPELFCGFHRRPGEGPTTYPVSCSPQAWAAGSALLLLQACLGLEASGRHGEIVLADPQLPAFLREVELKRLRVAGGAVDLSLVRRNGDVLVQIVRSEGPVRVVSRSTASTGSS